MAITLKTVIAELQFIEQLNQEDPTNSRLSDLVDKAKLDLAAAAQSIGGNDDVLPPPPE